MPNTPADPNHPTKEPFTSAGESKTGDQVSRKVTRAADNEEPTPTATPTTKE
ncbi:hypothetical protein PS6_000780 [Mucor atramentarius]